MWEFLDKIVYINLDNRTDRLESMAKFIENGKFPLDKVIRFPAIKDYPGTVGCSKSHIAVLKLAIKNNWSNVLILEDDIEWVGDINNFYKKIRELVYMKNDVILLGGGYNCLKNERVLFSYCTSSYLVKNHYYTRLLSNFESSLMRMTGNTDMTVTPGTEEAIKKDNINEIDTAWSKLMRMDNWRAVIPQCVTQITSYSDVIEGIRYWQIIDDINYPFKHTEFY